MRKILTVGSLGVLCTAGGFALAIKSFIQLDNFLFLLPALLLELIGILLLFYTNKSYDSILAKLEIPLIKITVKHTPSSHSGELVKQHNELLEKWKKTVRIRDKLKLLKISASDKK